MTLHKPANETEAAAIVRDAQAKKTPLAIEGGGTRQGLGRPVQAYATLSSRAMSGIVFYEPAEMVIRARAGTPVAEIESAIAAKGQMLPFEPMDHRALYGSAGEPTIGAIAACNISGPRRIRNGAARDSLLGVRFVNGNGEIVQSGGRVMKNVTGLDLTKAQCGAHGTLGFLTEVTFKLIPATESSGSLLLEGLDETQAIAAMSAALGSPFEVSGAAHLPGEGVCLRIEHFSPSVAYRLDALAKLLAPFGPAKRLDEDASRALWLRIRDIAPLQGGDSAIWRISVAPSHAPAIISQLRADGFSPEYYFDWGGGLIWLAVLQEGDGAAQRIRVALAGVNGHATLVRGNEELRNAIDVFQPPSAPLMHLTRGLKSSFDPAGILNAGRMYAGL